MRSTVGESWILGESLNGSMREIAAHFSGRDVPTEVGSRNLFHLPVPPLRICETPFSPTFNHTRHPRPWNNPVDGFRFTATFSPVLTALLSYWSGFAGGFFGYFSPARLPCA